MYIPIFNKYKDMFSLKVCNIVVFYVTEIMLTIEDEYNTPQQYNYRKITKPFRVVYTNLIDRVLQYTMS